MVFSKKKSLSRLYNYFLQLIIVSVLKFLILPRFAHIISPICIIFLYLGKLDGHALHYLHVLTTRHCTLVFKSFTSFTLIQLEKNKNYQLHKAVVNLDKRIEITLPVLKFIRGVSSRFNGRLYWHFAKTYPNTMHQKKGHASETSV